jgi:hypothetical protein
VDGQKTFGSHHLGAISLPPSTHGSSRDVPCRHSEGGKFFKACAPMSAALSVCNDTVPEKILSLLRQSSSLVEYDQGIHPGLG